MKFSPGESDFLPLMESRHVTSGDIAIGLSFFSTLGVELIDIGESKVREQEDSLPPFLPLFLSLKSGISVQVFNKEN